MNFLNLKQYLYVIIIVHYVVLGLLLYTLLYAEAHSNVYIIIIVQIYL